MLAGKYKWPNIVFQNRLTLEQKELCRCRLKLLTYLDRLATYEVRGSFNQSNYVHSICHCTCCACLCCGIFLVFRTIYVGKICTEARSFVYHFC